MKNGRLILHPGAPLVVPASTTGFVEGLRDMEFLASSWETAPENHFLAGARFLHLITFLGCSPHVLLQPPDDMSLNFCHIAISGPSNRLRFIAGNMSAAPRCPRCREKVSTWKQMIEVWSQDQAGFRWACPSCGTESEATALDWRRGAGFGRFFLEIRNIFPGEAVPSDELMQALTAFTDTPWNYFYAAR